MQQGEFGKRLKRLRELRKRSQKQIADKVFVERKVISRYENGGSLPVELADDVLKALNGIYVLGADLSEETYRQIIKLVANDRKQRLRKEREKQNAVFQKQKERQKGAECQGRS